ncbi:MAG: carboxyl transferase domain-containing protein, partial [Halobacteriales archaeon]
MKVRIGDGASDEEASAIGAALARRFGDDVEVYVGSADEPAAIEEATGSARAPPPAEDGLGPTERELQLWEEIEEIHEGGPEKYKEQLPEEGKRFVRDRIDLWFGEDGFLFEDGRFAEFDADDRLPADGLITGGAEIEGREVHFMANDYTVKRGSMAEKGVDKFLKMQQRALKTGRPVLYLMDSSGGRIDQQTGFFANREGIGKYYYNHSMLSGYVPQVCVLYGPCIAGAAYTPVFADFTVMVRGMSAMAIASPRMVEMVTGEEIGLQELGGPDVHMQESGSADLIADDEEHARELVADLMGYLPDNANEDPPKADPKPPAKSPAGIDSVVPEDPNRGYDVMDVIERVVDADSFFELRPEYGREIVTGY